MKLLFRLIVPLVLFGALNCFGMTARELLASPLQVERNLGARILQQTFVPTPRAHWNTLTNQLPLGTKKADVRSVLQAVKATPLGAGTTGTSETNEYRLDDVWVLDCSFTNSALSALSLEEKMIDVWVPPPANFTGEWATFWVNGQLSTDQFYQNGLLEGFSTKFHPNGSKAVVAFYRNNLRDGEETGFYPSGQVQYRGQYRAGKPVGRWVWFKENGSVESTKDYDKKASERQRPFSGLAWNDAVEKGSTRLSRVVFGVPPNTRHHQILISVE